MGPTRWRKSTHVFVGLAVLAFVAAIVAAATFFTTAGHGNAGSHAPVPPPRPPTVKPGMVPVTDTAAVPGVGGLAAALGAVAAETGATVNQVVLAWMIGGELPVIPLVGASSVAQLEESLGAVDLELSADQRSRLDAAG